VPSPVPCIGVFDSGVGGLSVLRELHRRLPSAALTYVGDVAFAPYGPRPAAEVLARCERIVGHLAGQGAALIVIACNTATVHAIETLRAHWPALRFVGVEPGVKPGVARTHTGRMAVMATSATVRSARMRRLLEHHAQGVHVHLQACPGLADAIEQGTLDGVALSKVLIPHCDRIRAADVDTVVLACTHYPFVAAEIQRLLGPGVALIDTAAAVAERVASVWADAQMGPAPAPQLRVRSTGSSQTLQRLLRECPGFETVQVEALAV
jgi:glutamate racemase